MQGYLSDALAMDWITELSTRAKFVSLHYELPNWTDPTASEISDPGYARQPVTWSIQSNRSISNTSILTFSINLTTAITAIGFHDDLTTSTMVCYATRPAQAGLIETDKNGFLIISASMIVLGFG